MKIRGAKNLESLLEQFNWQHSADQIKQGFVLEGGSGAGKTQDIIRFLAYYCQRNEGKGKDILIFRQTLADLKKTVYKDFINFLKVHNIYDPNHDAQSPPMHYDLFGNVIYFSGLDVMGAHGERHDIIWGNEAMEIDKDAFKQLNQRCNECFILDYNPSEVEHWVFEDIIPRPDTKFFKSTLLDNPFLPRGQRDEILAYEPTSKNILNGTADEFLWNVYGLGLRSAPEGLVFQNVNWVKSMPDAETFYYGMDFGSVHPTVLVKGCVVDRDIFFEIMFYEPCDNPDRISELMKSKGITEGDMIWADSASAGNISYLRRKGWTVLAVSKPKDSVINGIGLMKNYRINLVDCPEWRKEQTGYRWQVVNGQRTGQPIKRFDDCFTADTLITTDMGLQRIDSIKAGTMVLTSKGFKTVIKKFDNGLKQIKVYLIHLDTFIICLTCTSNHLIKTKTGWVSVQNLESGTEVFLHNLSTERFTNFILEKDTSVGGNLFQCIVKCGNFIKAKYRKAIISIIKITIRGIIKLIILNFLRLVFMLDYTLQIIGLKQKKGKSIIERYKNLQRHGIQVMRVLSGMLSMGKNHGLIESIKTRHANNAAKNIGHGMPENQNIAITTARLQRIEVIGSSEQLTYDLMIDEEHEYFANGILVHNCWDAARYLVMANLQY